MNEDKKKVIHNYLAGFMFTVEQVELYTDLETFELMGKKFNLTLVICAILLISLFNLVLERTALLH